MKNQTSVLKISLLNQCLFLYKVVAVLVTPGNIARPPA